MKSSTEALRKRGYIDDMDVSEYNVCTSSELLDMMSSREAYKRSIAVRMLSHGLNSEIAAAMLKLLLKEKSLYTRLEICNALEKGDKKIAELMIPYLGEIGHNQHKYEPGKVSKKVCYPLPRDIIARTMGRMNISVLDVLLSALEYKKIPIIYEAIDAIGYMCFYNDIMDKHSAINLLLNCMNKYSSDNVMRWKVVRCMSAFKCNESIEVLSKMYAKESHPIIMKEISRSLGIIKNILAGSIND